MPTEIGDRAVHMYCYGYTAHWDAGVHGYSTIIIDGDVRSVIEGAFLRSSMHRAVLSAYLKGLEVVGYVSRRIFVYLQNPNLVRILDSNKLPALVDAPYPRQGDGHGVFHMAPKDLWVKIIPWTRLHNIHAFDAKHPKDIALMGQCRQLAKDAANRGPLLVDHGYDVYPRTRGWNGR